MGGGVGGWGLDAFPRAGKGCCWGLKDLCFEYDCHGSLTVWLAGWLGTGRVADALFGCVPVCLSSLSAGLILLTVCRVPGVSTVQRTRRRVRGVERGKEVEDRFRLD